jgi:hypothetical protein
VGGVLSASQGKRRFRTAKYEGNPPLPKSDYDFRKVWQHIGSVPNTWNKFLPSKFLLLGSFSKLEQTRERERERERERAKGPLSPDKSGV